MARSFVDRNNQIENIAHYMMVDIKESRADSSADPHPLGFRLSLSILCAGLNVGVTSGNDTLCDISSPTGLS